MDTYTLSISFSGEAAESFSDWVAEWNEWYVQITPQTGEPFDAVLLGSALDVEIDGNTWYDAVSFLRADPSTGLALDGAEPEAVRVKDVFIY